MATPNPVRAVWDFLRGEDLKVRPPALVETQAIEPGTAQQKLYYWNHPGSLFTSNMWGPTGPLVHGPGASALYGGWSGVPIASNSAVFACLGVIAKAYQEAPLRVFKKDHEGDEAWLDAHPFQALLDDPHPALTPPELNWWLVVCKHVQGNAYLRKVRAGAGNPAELWPISPMRLRPVTTDADRRAGVFISHYRHEYEPAKYEDVPVEDVVHFRLGVDDADHRLGCSPLQRLIREVATDEEATAFTASLLSNMGAAGLVVTLPPGALMTQEEAEELRERIDAAFKAEGRGRTSVLTNGATMAQMGFDPQKMGLKDVHRLPEERIAAVLGVHPMVVGLGAGLDRSIFNNYSEARDALFEQTIIPLYTADEATLTKQLLRPDFDTDPDVRLRHDLTDVRALQEDMNQVYARLSLAVEKGWVKRNEARNEVGLEPIPGWDEQDERDSADLLPDTGGGPAGLLESGDEEEGEQRGRRLLPQQKAQGLGAIPALLDAVHELAAPSLERDLAAYFQGQHQRVRGRLRRAQR